MKLSIHTFLSILRPSFTSSKYPDAMKNIEDIEFNGITYNATTSNYLTNYFMYGSSKFWKYIVDIMVNSYIDFKFDDIMLEKERQAIINELTPMLHKEEMIDYNIYNLFVGKVRKSPLERIKSVKNATTEKLLNFRKKYYSPKNTKIIISGDVDYKKIYSLVKCISSKKLNINNKIYKINDSIFKKIPNKINFFKSQQKEIQIDIVFNLDINHYDKDRFSLPAISSNLQSNLFKRLRYSQENVIYSISCGADLQPNKKISYFSISTGTEKINKLGTILEIILEEVSSIKNKLISKYNYDKIKNKLNTEKIIELNSNNFSDIINYYFPYILYNRKVQSRQVSIKNYESVTRQI